MPVSRIQGSRLVRRLATLSLLAVAVGVAGCGDDDDGGGDDNGLPASTSYAGFVSSTDGQTGPLSITFASAVAAPPMQLASGTGPTFSSGAPVNATGTVSIGGGAPVAITGNIEGGTLTMTGGGWTLNGSLLNGMIVGTFTGPGGISGSLSAVSSTEGSPAKTYCGYFEGSDLTEDPPTAEYGTFSMVIAGDVLLGTAVSDGGDVIDFTGTATATSITVHMVNSQGELNASGTYGADGAEGQYNTKVSGVTVGTGAWVGYPDCAPL